MALIKRVVGLRHLFSDQSAGQRTRRHNPDSCWACPKTEAILLDRILGLEWQLRHLDFLNYLRDAH